MNREIHFRAKRSSDGGWVEGDLLHLRGTTSISSHLLDGVYDVDPDTVGQYIGLRDSYGKKIFEGDIIDYRDESGEIVYDNCIARFAIEFDTWVTDFDSIYSNEIRVIGNLHDNPELLKGDQT